MKAVIVHPERCVGCLQCSLACATAHSRSQTLVGAALESPRPRARIHVGAGWWNEGFPNRCRHCDPAPCSLACLTGAIYRRASTGTVMINPDRCINCASCAMACPYGVVRYHEDPLGPPGRAIAVKCDNCSRRVAEGLTPACVTACMTQALTWEEMDSALQRQTHAVARSMSRGQEEPVPPAGVALQRSHQQAQVELQKS